MKSFLNIQINLFITKKQKKNENVYSLELSKIRNIKELDNLFYYIQYKMSIRIKYKISSLPLPIS